MNTLNHYKPEELVPIVGKLAEKYTSGESTSVTYEKAEQLMGAVVYCIQEASQPWETPAETIVTKAAASKAASAKPMADQSPLEQLKSEKATSNAPAAKIPAAGAASAWQAYEAGAAKVRQKTRRALQIYNELLPKLNCYGSRCLSDTVVKGLPEFFKWYDVSFHPQDTILTLDYPILKDRPDLTGVDRIYQYILYIKIEQMFLGHFPEEHIIAILRNYHPEYEDLPENISAIVFQSVVGHILAEKPLSKPDLTKDDYQTIQNYVLHTDSSEPDHQLRQTIRFFLEQYYGASAAVLLDYFQSAINAWIVRLKHMAEIH